jgi:hypothetical protein
MSKHNSAIYVTPTFWVLSAMAISFWSVTLMPLKSLSQPNPTQHAAQRCRIVDLGAFQNCPIPLRFESGAYGTLVNDQLKRIPGTRYYSLKARAGQRLTLTFAGKGALRAGLTFPNGGGDGPFSGEGNTIKLPQTGTYIIYVGQNTMSGEPWRGPFSLAVIVK